MKNIRFLIGIMLLALLALIAFQAYWIKNAIAVKNEQFDRIVRQTLKETIEKIEKQEIIYITKQKLAEIKGKRLLALSKNVGNKKALDYDSMLFAKRNNFEKLNETIKNDRNNNQRSIASEKKFRKNFMDEESFVEAKLHHSSIDWLQKQENLNEIFALINQDPTFNSSIEKHLKASSISDKNKLEQANLVKSVFRDFVKGKRTIYERFGHLMIDTLLHDQFKSNGIDLPFEYEVKDKDLTIFASNGSKVLDNSKSYRAKLFPNDTFEQDQYLQVVFPDKQNYIYKNLWNLLAISSVLVLLVGGIFVYSVNSLLNQSKLSQIKNDFINNMTHELKTPVSTIGLALTVMKDKEIDTNEEKKIRYLGIIDQENKRLGKQIEKVLQIAQLEKGDVKLNFEPLDVFEILEEIIRNLSIQTEQLGVSISLAKNTLNTMCMADKVHLTNVFFNLLDNAIKYSNENPKIEILINEWLEIKFIDNGIGISKDQMTKIFDKFYRVPTGNLHDVKGFGLGLSYVKKMIEMHHGKITVMSKLNQGSVFIVKLPNYENPTS